MSTHDSIKTNSAGKHAAAKRDGRHAKANAPTEPITIAPLSSRPTEIPTVKVGGALGDRPAYAVDIGKGVTAYVRDGVGSARQATLIAAAPEMLEALRLMESAHMDLTGANRAIALDNAAKYARAAIAKATGVQS